MVEAWRSVLVEKLGDAAVDGLYILGSAAKRWDSLIDYVPELSDVDLRHIAIRPAHFISAFIFVVLFWFLSRKLWDKLIWYKQGQGSWVRLTGMVVVVAYIIVLTISGLRHGYTYKKNVEDGRRKLWTFFFGLIFFIFGLLNFTV